jgi:hypothetical protein
MQWITSSTSGLRAIANPKDSYDDFLFDTFIETGTYYGATSKWFAETFPDKETHTIENNFDNYQNALKTLSSTANVYCHFGDSIDLIKEVASIFPIQKPFFYLDAHWYNKWPLLNELDIISTLYKDNCCIMIDDFQTPYRPFQYDKYDGRPNNLEYILPTMNKVFTDPFFFFMEKSTRTPRPVGKIILFPKAWTTSLELKEDRGYLYY